jgi:hypothetical protein
MNPAMSKSAVHRCLLLLAWCLVFAPFAAAQSSDLDKYGGTKALKCAKATGWFHTEKIASQWWLCTPPGNVFFMNGIEGVNLGVDTTYYNLVQTKYAGMPWTFETNLRLRSWGFNTLATGAYGASIPTGIDVSFPTDSHGLRSQPVKMPFTLSIRPAYEAMINPVISTGNLNQRLLTVPVKNMLFGHSPYYTGYIASGGVADYYDSGIGTWLQKDLHVDSPWSTLNSSPYLNYLIGITSDDGDEMNGFGATPDFATNPPGFNSFNLGMMVAAMSPVQTANPQWNWVYSDTVLHTKQALRDFLVAKNSTVAALNTAWGSNYTTFDSSGTQITGELIAVGDGATLAFNHTFAHPVPSKLSVQIFVNQVPIAGDTQNGDIFGPDVTGRINQKAGGLMLVWRPGHAPPPQASITVNYIQNGWGIGSGFMDEDARPAHQSWMGNDWIAMSNANANVKADMNAFLQQMAGQYFQTCRKQLKTVFPNIMYLGPDSLSGYSVPPPAPVLKAAAQYIEAFVTANDGPIFTQAMMDYIEQNYGDKPYFGSYYSAANPDSALNGHANPVNPGGFTTQADRGQTYYIQMVQILQTMHTTAGNHPYIGLTWFDYVDSWGEKINWGLVTHLDNAYDGHEAVRAAVACSEPISRYRCGGERADYGDLISSVAKANTLWLDIARRQGEEGNAAKTKPR